jgi:hypothetical protein
MRVLLVAVLTAAAATTPAHAVTSRPGPGATCAFVSLTDPGMGGGEVLSGLVLGGPLAAFDDAGSVVGGELACTIQVGSGTHGDETNDTFRVSTTDTAVVVQPPAEFTIPAPPNVPVYLCTEFRPYDDSPPLYWADQNDADPMSAGRWSTNHNVACELAVALSDDDPAVQAVLDTCGPTCRDDLPVVDRVFVAPPRVVT